MPDKNNTAKKAGILTVASAQKAMPGLYPAAALGKMAASRVFSAEKDPNDPGRMTDEKMESLNDAIDSRGSEIDAVEEAGKKKKKKKPIRLEPMKIKGTVE